MLTAVHFSRQFTDVRDSAINAIIRKELNGRVMKKEKVNKQLSSYSVFQITKQIKWLHVHALNLMKTIDT